MKLRINNFYLINSDVLIKVIKEQYNYDARRREWVCHIFNDKNISSLILNERTAKFFRAKRISKYIANNYLVLHNI